MRAVLFAALIVLATPAARKRMSKGGRAAAAERGDGVPVGKLCRGRRPHAGRVAVPRAAAPGVPGACPGRSGSWSSPRELPEGGPRPWPRTRLLGVVNAQADAKKELRSFEPRIPMLKVVVKGGTEDRGRDHRRRRDPRMIGARPVIPVSARRAATGDGMSARAQEDQGRRGRGRPSSSSDAGRRAAAAGPAEGGRRQGQRASRRSLKRCGWKYRCYRLLSLGGRGRPGVGTCSRCSRRQAQGRRRCARAAAR
jgi:hypothetical protein